MNANCPRCSFRGGGDDKKVGQIRSNEPIYNECRFGARNLDQTDDFSSSPDRCQLDRHLDQDETKQASIDVLKNVIGETIVFG